MKFIGRAREMGLLEKDSQKKSSFTLITGRRRVGKTRLIKEFYKGRDALYFLATAQNAARLLEDFSDTVSAYSGNPVGRFASWSESFRYLSSLGREVFVALDEFQNVLVSDEGAKAEFQYIWDELLSSGSVHLILCGSHIGVLENLCDDYDSPLYGRFTRHITVQPLSFEEVRTDDFRSSLEMYSVLGGVPSYMELFGSCSPEQGVIDNVFEPSSQLFNEPETLLRGEVKGLPSYMSIMRAVANGHHRISAIAGAVEVPATTLGPYLRKLIEIRMLKRVVPVTEKDPESSKQSLYVISDYYTAFWFKFVHPYVSFLVMGNTAPSLKRFHDDFIDSHVSFVFEDVCREQVFRMTEAIGFAPEKVGSYWSRDVEIDVVAVNDTERKVFLAECKYWRDRPVDHKVLTSLKEKAESVRDLNGYDKVFGLFSVSGFEDSLLEERGVVLVDRGTLLRHRGVPLGVK